MATFEVQSGGKTYEIEAPDQAAAMDAIRRITSASSPAAPPPANMAAGPVKTVNADDSRDVLGAALQGATLGFADEAAGAFGGAMDWLGFGPDGSKGTFSGGYDRTVGKARAKLEKYRAAHPIESGVAEAGGILATLPIAGSLNVVKAPAVANPIANFLLRGAAETANSAATGALYAGAYGAGTAEGGLTNRVENALQSAPMGAAVGALAPAAVGALKAGGRVIGRALGHPVSAARALTRPATEAERRVVRAAERDASNAGSSLGAQQTMLDTAQRAGVPMTALDIGETTRALGRAAANTSPEGRDVLGRMVGARFEGQGTRAIDLINRNAPGVNSPQTRLLLEQAAARANRPAYARAYMDGEAGIWHEGLAQLTFAPAMRTAIRNATTTGANKAAVEGVRPPRNPFIEAADGTLTLPPNVRPNLRFWDAVKQNLDSEIGRAQRSGDNPLVRDLTIIKNQLVSYLDEAVPSYRAARQGAAAFFGADDAITAGEGFVTSRMDNVAGRDALARMSPAERQLFAEGFATRLIASIRETGDRRNLVISQMFGSPAARERVAIALGPRAAREMEAFLLAENVMDLGRMAVQGNSTTARQLMELGLAGGAGAGAGLLAGGGNLSDPRTWIVAALTGVTLRAGRAAVSGAETRVAREIAELLASQDPQRFREAVNRIGQSPGMLASLRKWHAAVTRAIVPQAGRMGPAPLPAVTTGGGPQPAYAGDQQPPN